MKSAKSTNSKKPRSEAIKRKFLNDSSDESPPSKKSKSEPDGEKKGNKTRKQIKLPGQPKRAMSSYFLWMNANRDEIKKDNPTLGIGAIAKKSGELWKALSDKSVSAFKLHSSIFEQFFI